MYRGAKQKRLHDRAIREKKKGITYTERTKLLQGITVYMTNIPTEWVPKRKSMIYIHCVGKLSCYLKYGNLGFEFIVVNLLNKSD